MDVMAFLIPIYGMTITTNIWDALSNRLTTSYTLMAVAILAFISYVTGSTLHLDTSGRIISICANRNRGMLRFVLYTFCFGLVSLVVLERFTGLTSHNGFLEHPLDALIQTAKGSHQAWIYQAATSHNLGTAVSEYKLRYGRDPPPGFDIWYRYATDRASLVIDDFDSISNDLAPFWAISPQELRLRTKQIVDTRWNEIVAIRIRNGSAYIPDMIPTHRWMIEGIERMMSPFIRHLPDMDIAFNINDEPRVAVPFDKLRTLSQISTTENNGPKSKDWSSDRTQSFDVLANQSSLGFFENWSFKSNFQKFGSLGCPSNSLARRMRSWDFSKLCMTCFKPHSNSLFVSDWNKAGSPCHQPDLGSMHGFYKGASAFKPTKKLMPVFSQSKAQGYSDILYPTAWNYNDKIKYEPSPENLDIPYSEKRDVLFWRGSTTEGFSGEGQWRSMARQRLVFLSNNSTQSQPVFLPLSGEPKRYAYQDLTRQGFLDHVTLRGSNLSLDARLTMIDRCGYGDCQREDKQFGTVSGVEFQEHWRYKYLMDMDGAGFSGRFLPFLQSRSLPFKTAIFREWYDSRITAWLHFVPIDIRLHGLWSTLAYFAGGFGRGKLDWTTLEPGEWIAESGREWAEQALRKEDMEIYFFRLLLEWGRLTDDRRDSLGFPM